jgi:hypothetical protein
MNYTNFIVNSIALGDHGDRAAQFSCALFAISPIGFPLKLTAHRPFHIPHRPFETDHRRPRDDGVADVEFFHAVDASYGINIEVRQTMSGVHAQPERSGILTALIQDRQFLDAIALALGFGVLAGV